MTDARDIKIKRLRMRSMRRGIKEMDLILSGFADAHLAQMSDADLTTYEDMLEESDHDLYQWVCGTTSPKDEFGEMISRVAAGAEGIVRP